MAGAARPKGGCMFDFFLLGDNKPAPPGPPAPAEEVLAEERSQSAGGREKTDLPPQFNADPDFEQPQVADALLPVSPPAPESTAEAGTPAGADETEPGAVPSFVKDVDADLRRYQRRASPGRRLVKKGLS